jgi:adenine-specific DNA-methyltransferase
VVIGNPPYIKEYEGKEIFDGLRDNEVYQGKMDIWYMFTANAIKLLKIKGTLNFIAPNNWITNSGASKMRNFMLSNSKIIQLIDFGSFMVFDSASIQTMIMQFTNEKSDNYTFDYRKIIATKPIFEDAIDLINNNKSEASEILYPNISIHNYINKLLTFTNNINDVILNKLKEKQTFFLDEKKEVAQGIVFPQDFINKASALKINDLTFVGKGIFGLSELEKTELELSESELKLIKPYYTSEQFSRYAANKKNKLWIIYTSSKFKNPDAILPYPNIKKHLDKFVDVITSDNKPYGLHRTREENFFKGEKIIVQRKCAGKPVFTYTDFDTYVSATFYVIKTENLNQKYLTGVLNSRLIEFWLKNKGKMQGNNFQLDKEPLLNIPLIKPNIEVQNKIESKVNEILLLKAEDSKTDTQVLEQEIDAMVYELYGLSAEEIAIVEGPQS